MENPNTTQNNEEDTEVPVAPEQAKVLLLGGVGTMLVALGTFASLSFFLPSEQSASVSEALPPVFVDPFDEVLLEARAAFVYDVTAQKEIYSLNGEAQLPLASITKLMTALIASENLTEEDVVSISKQALSQDGDSGFSESEHFSSKDLMALALLSSSNDGAYALAESSGGEGSDISDFVSEMNEKSRELGLTQTYFINPTGLDDSEHVSGGYGSAKDIAHLMQYLIEKAAQIVEVTSLPSKDVTSLEGNSYHALNTNTEVGNLSGLIASKTGFTDLAGGNLVIAFDAGVNHPMIAVVLGSTEAGRFRDVKKLVSGSRSYLALPHLAARQETVE